MACGFMCHSWIISETHLASPLKILLEAFSCFYKKETHHNTPPHLPTSYSPIPSTLSFLVLLSSSQTPHRPPSTRHLPAKLTVPSSVQNESGSHYNRTGQIPLALSEIKHREQGAGGNSARPYQRERVSSTDVTNPPGGIQQTHTHKERQLGARQRERTHPLF